MRKRLLFFVLFVLLVCAAGAVFLLTLPKGTRKADFRLLSDPVLAGDHVATLAVVLRPPGFFGNQTRRTRYGVDLWLHDVSDPTRMETLPIVERGEEMALIGSARGIGFDGRRYWFFGSTLVGLDLKSRERVGVAELARANPALAKSFVEDGKAYRLMGNRIVVGGFEIDPATLVATPHTDGAQSLLSYDEQRDISGPDPARYFWHGDLKSEREWFGLLSEEEAKDRALRLRVRSTGVKRSFWRGRLGELKRVSDVEYVDGSLLRAEDRPGALRLEEPAGYLVLHRSAETLLVTRVDEAGKQLWQVDSGIRKLEYVLPGKRNLVLFGDPLRIYSFDLANGTKKDKKILELD